MSLKLTRTQLYARAQERALKCRSNMKNRQYKWWVKRSILENLKCPLAQLIYATRIQYGLRQIEMAEMIGCGQSKLSKIENIA